LKIAAEYGTLEGPMFYFFQKGRAYLRCELRPLSDGSCEMLIEEPDRPERTEQFQTSQQAQQRWMDLQQEYNVGGWAGPFGRE
jgi:hypothetical protein